MGLHSDLHTVTLRAPKPIHREGHEDYADDRLMWVHINPKYVRVSVKKKDASGMPKIIGQLLEIVIEDRDNSLEQPGFYLRIDLGRDDLQFLLDHFDELAAQNDYNFWLERDKARLQKSEGKE